MDGTFSHPYPHSCWESTTRTPVIEERESSFLSAVSNVRSHVSTDTFTPESGHIGQRWGPRPGSKVASRFLNGLTHVLISCFPKPADGDGGFFLLRLSVASPEDLTDPRVAERLVQQVREHSRGQERGSEY